MRKTAVGKLAAAPAPAPSELDSSAAPEVDTGEDFLDPLAQAGKAAEAPRRRGGPVPSSGAPEPVPGLPPDSFAAYTGKALTEQDFADAANQLGCEVAAVKAVAEVESAGAGFDPARRPTILYERHVFARCTTPNGKFDAQHPDISGLRRPYPPGGYGRKDQQYAKLARAFALDPVAALKAPSWGRFQILGENHKACGFASVMDFVRAMTVSDAEHLQAFINFVQGNGRLLTAIRQKDWAAFARSYNGPNFAAFKYDTKLAAAYAKHAAA